MIGIICVRKINHTQVDTGDSLYEEQKAGTFGDDDSKSDTFQKGNYFIEKASV